MLLSILFCQKICFYHTKIARFTTLDPVRKLVSAIRSRIGIIFTETQNTRLHTGYHKFSNGANFIAKITRDKIHIPIGYPPKFYLVKLERVICLLPLEHRALRSFSRTNK